MTPLISVVHATRERPEQALFVCGAWYGAADHPDQIEWLFGVDEDDEASCKLLSGFDATRYGTAVATVVNRGPRTSIEASNVAFRASRGRVLIQCSDDYYAPSHWDTEILKRFGDLDKPAVLGTGDPNGRVEDNPKYSGDGLLTMVCATRAYLERVGYFYYPEYAGVMVDFDFTQKAAADHVLIDAYEDLHFIHDWRGGKDDPQQDETYRRHLSEENGKIGVQVWEKRRNQLLPDLDLKPFDDGDARASFVRGDYEQARRRVESDLDYYAAFCGGRFNYYFGKWLRDVRLA